MILWNMSSRAKASSTCTGLTSPDITANSSMSSLVSVRDRLTELPTLSSSKVRFSMTEPGCWSVSAEDVVPGIDIVNISGDCLGLVAYQKGRQSADIVDRDKPVFGGLFGRALEQLVEMVDT